MLRINDITLPLDYDQETVKKAAAKKLNISVSEIESAEIYKRSTDARKKNAVCFRSSVDVTIYGGAKSESRAEKRCKSANIVKEYQYTFPKCAPSKTRPVIVGSGPCGLFAALVLAQAGQRPIIVERGRDVDRRTSDIARFWSGSDLDEISNVQFGEGGAGTFSDGKLTTGTKDIRIRKVLEEFVAHGAPKEILYLAKPHIGTDMLKNTIKNIRNDILSLGGEVFFETQMTGIKSRDGVLTGIEVISKGEKRIIETNTVLLAIGHSARDTFEMLLQSGIVMQQKPFAMGVRIEHLQKNINIAQYGDFCSSPYLSAADYKLAAHLKNGRGVYTFCMCPGGTVVAAASEKNHLVTNGMSEFARDGVNANSALLVGINPSDFGSEEILAGVKLQRKLESKAFIAGGQNYYAPVQRVCDFLNGTKSAALGSVIPSYQPGTELSALNEIFPDFMTESIGEGIKIFDTKLHGFADGDAVLTAVESRSSSPVRMIRDETMQSVSLKGLYPCGEGAGYAGGIMSAAVDGIKAAERRSASAVNSR